MATEQMTSLRNALKACCPTGVDREAVNVPQLGEMLNRTGEVQHQSIRRQIATMMRRGEVRKVDRGLFIYVPSKEPQRHGESHIKMWRAIRMQHKAFTVLEIVQLTRVHATTVHRYIYFLLDQGFIKKQGKDGNTNRYVVQDKGKEHRTTPYPPINPVDPFQQERAACATLCRIFMTEDVSLLRVAYKVREQLALLNTRFSQHETQGEKL